MSFPSGSVVLGDGTHRAGPREGAGSHCQHREICKAPWRGLSWSFCSFPPTLSLLGGGGAQHSVVGKLPWQLVLGSASPGQH